MTAAAVRRPRVPWWLLIFLAGLALGVFLAAPGPWVLEEKVTVSYPPRWVEVSRWQTRALCRAAKWWAVEKTGKIYRCRRDTGE